MLMEGVDHWGHGATAEAMDIEEALRRLQEIEERPSASREFTDDFLLQENFFHGLAMAIPLSLCLWATIGVLVWALLR